MYQTIEIDNFTTESGAYYTQIPLTYQIFGLELHSAPIICVNHALTGSATVTGDNGWWQQLIGSGKAIDTRDFTVIAFNIPGNGQDGFVVNNYHDFIAKDVARLFLMGLERLRVRELMAIIGGSLGGGLAWEMAALAPNLSKHIVAIACDYQASDWLIANCHLQEQILLNSKQPVNDARMHAMLCYRTPISFKQRFNRGKQADTSLFQVESWLNHHGDALDKRFQLPAYLLMNQLLKSVNVMFDQQPELIAHIKSHIHIIAIDSDLFFPVAESRAAQQRLAQKNLHVSYHEIHSDHGHDAFLIEYEQLSAIIDTIINPLTKSKRTRVLKFGGRSLASEEGGFNYVSDIIKGNLTRLKRLVVVLSARGDTTAKLVALLDAAVAGHEYHDALKALIAYQQPGQLADLTAIDFSSEITFLEKRLQGVQLIGDYSAKTRDEILAQGELMAVKTMQAVLSAQGVQTCVLNTRELIVTDNRFGQALPIDAISAANVAKTVANMPEAAVILAAGFVGSTENGETTTLGLNGSNYTAALLANYLDADEVHNYTHVDGLYTADPNWVEDARKIPELTFAEANELAHLGTNILHAKTIIPLLQKNIPLRLLNTFNPDDEGTLITAESGRSGIKCISTEQNVALINLEGRGLLGQAGVDARIFNALGRYDISVNMIAQSAAERGISLVVSRTDAPVARRVLEDEFRSDIERQDVTQIVLLTEVAVVSAIGLSLGAFNRPLNALIQNRIRPLLMNNSINGKNISLVVHSQQLVKAVNVIHGAIFGAVKRIHLALFGHGVVGSAFIEQVLNAHKKLAQQRQIQLKIIAISNSRQLLLDKEGITGDWQKRLTESHVYSSSAAVIAYAEQHHLENVIAVDNTASSELVSDYPDLIQAGFDLVSSNKIANTLDFEFYQNLRKLLTTNYKSYLYETNVGAGLPLIDTIRTLHQSGENITAIRGIFSGSLSYIFNRFGAEEVVFSDVVKAAMAAGFTEPDPRHDLNGQDVARKLLILARELDLAVEMHDVVVENLIPKNLATISTTEFDSRLAELDTIFQQRKEQLNAGQVLRYVGELSGDLMTTKTAKLTVSLQVVNTEGPLGSVRGSDSLFEIFTNSYGERPMVIQGAGAGAQVTARGVLGDVLRIAAGS